jgi:hypothetical protein
MSSKSSLGQPRRVFEHDEPSLVSLLKIACISEEKKRFLDGRVVAQGAFAGLLQPFPFLEDKPALAAFRGCHSQAPALFVSGLLDVMEMFVNFLFGDAELHGQLMGRQGPLLHGGNDSLPDRFQSFLGNTRRPVLFHGASSGGIMYTH